jgi:hypothetical protein
MNCCQALMLCVTVRIWLVLGRLALMQCFGLVDGTLTDRWQMPGR